MLNYAENIIKLKQYKRKFTRAYPVLLKTEQELSTKTAHLLVD